MPLVLGRLSVSCVSFYHYLRELSLILLQEPSRRWLLFTHYWPCTEKSIGEATIDTEAALRFGYLGIWRMCRGEAMAPIDETTRFVKRWLDTLDTPTSPLAQLRRDMNGDNTGVDAQGGRNDDIDGRSQALPVRGGDDGFPDNFQGLDSDGQHDDNHGRGGAQRVPLPKPSTTWTQYLTPIPTMLLPSEPPLPTTTNTPSTASSISSASSASSKSSISSKAPVEVTSVVTSTAVGFERLASCLNLYALLNNRCRSRRKPPGFL